MNLRRIIITILVVSLLMLGLGFITGYYGSLFFKAVSPQLSSFKGNAEDIYLIGQNYSYAKFKSDRIFFNTNETVDFNHVKNITIESETGETSVTNNSSLQVRYAKDIPQSLSNVDMTILFENLTMKGSLTNFVQLYGYMNNMELKSNGAEIVLQRPWVDTVIIGAKEFNDFSRISFEIDNTSSVESDNGIITLGVFAPSDLIVSIQQPSKIILKYGEGELGLNGLNSHKFEIRSVDSLDIDLIPNYQSNLLINGTRVTFEGVTDSVKLNYENIIISESSYWFITKPEALFSGLTMVFTLVLAIATVFLAVISYLQVRAANKQIRESEATRKTMFLPMIRPNLRFITPEHAFLEIRNDGSGSARNVQVKYWSEFNKDAPAVWKSPLFSPNETKNMALKKNNEWVTKLDDLRLLETINFEIEYTDTWEEKKSFNYNLDLKNLIDGLQNESGVIPFEEKVEVKIENHLKAISDKLIDVKSLRTISNEIELLTNITMVEKVKSFLKDNLQPGSETTSIKIGEELGLDQIKAYLICSKIKKLKGYSLDLITTGQNLYYVIKKNK